MKKKLFYWIPTGLLLFVMVGSAVQYVVDLPATKEAFGQLGYPGYVVYFNATAKLLGAIAILFPVWRTLKEWAYAGYLFILLLAMQAIYVSMSPAFSAVMLGFIALWGLSYWRYRVDVQ